MPLSNSVSGNIHAAGNISLFTAKNSVLHPKGIVLILHGLAEHLGRYDHVVSSLNDAGYSTCRYDHRGHGRSGGERGYLEDFNLLIEDADRMVDAIRVENPGVPLFMLGHSMGGFVTAGYGIRHPEKVQGQIFSGAALCVLPITYRLRKVAYTPSSRVMIPKIVGRLLCRNKAVVHAYAKDPLVLRKISWKLLEEVFLTGAGWLMENMAGHTAPCLILHGGDDVIVTPAASHFMYDHTLAKDKTIKIYTGLFHEILNESQQDTVLADISTWLDKRV